MHVFRGNLKQATTTTTTANTHKETGVTSNRKTHLIYLFLLLCVFSGSGATQGNCLVLKSRIQLNDLLEDPLFAIVFTLDYVISETLSDKDRKVGLEPVVVFSGVSALCLSHKPCLLLFHLHDVSLMCLLVQVCVYDGSK